MRDLLADPLYHASDLGATIPDSPFGVSVCLPTWDHVVGYEEGDPEILAQFKSGYPRFFMPPLVARLNQKEEAASPYPGAHCMVFPKRSQAERCAAYVKSKGFEVLGITEHAHGAGVIHLPEAAYKTARYYWRLAGEGVSLRQSQWLLGETEAPSEEAAQAARQTLRDRLSHYSGQPAEDIYLFPSGMAASFMVHRMLLHLFPDRKTAQLDFPYMDVLKLQEEFGNGVHFFPFASDADYDKLHALIKKEALGGIFAEIPSNPLLKCVDLRRVVEMLFLEERDTPIIIDDTVASSVNLDAFLVADVVTTSLTKAFSGVGDVMAGAITLNRESPFYADFKHFLETYNDYELWAGDAMVLEENSRRYEARAQKFSQNGLQLFEYLSAHPAVERVYHSVTDPSGFYDHLLKPEGGHGCLLSFTLKDSSKAPALYDRLPFCKGPSLGTDYTLICPFVLLALYQELDWAETCGLPRHLLRVSVGTEDFEVIRERFDQAFAAL